MAEAALERLREAIIMGELTPGTPLRLEDLARSLGMSISPIREAVRQLEALGLAEHVPHHGAKVMGLDVEELRELFSIRLALEGMAAAARGRALRAEADEEAARAHLTAYDEARHRGDMRAAVRAHTAYHFALYEAARSGWLLRLIRPAWDSCERYRPVLLAEGAVQDRHEELDVELLEACAAHEPDRAAARAARAPRARDRRSTRSSSRAAASSRSRTGSDT